jgi:hypothetical protein
MSEPQKVIQVTADGDGKEAQIEAARRLNRYTNGACRSQRGPFLDSKSPVRAKNTKQGRRGADLTGE